MRRLIIIFFTVFVFGTAGAQTATSSALEDNTEGKARADLERGLAQLDNNDISMAVDTLQANQGPLVLEDLIRHHEALAIALAYTEDTEASLNVFRKLLAISPGHALPYTISPKASFVFERARAEMAQTSATAVELSLPEILPYDESLPVTMNCRSNALGLVKRWSLCHRLKGTKTPYRCQEFAAQDLAKPQLFDLPAVPRAAEQGQGDAETGVLLQVALLGYDSHGNEVFRGPGKARPLEARLGGERPQLWYQNPLVLGAGAVASLALVASTITIIILAQPRTASVVVEEFPQ